MSEKKLDIFDVTNNMINKVWSFFYYIVTFFKYLFQYAVKKFLISILFLIISASLFFSLNYFRSAVYVSDAIIQLNASNSSKVIPYINSLDLTHPRELSRITGIDEQYLIHLKSIKSYYMVDLSGNEIPDEIDLKENMNFLDANISKIEDLLFVRIKTFDTILISKLNNHFLNLFSQQPFKRLNEERLSYQKQQHNQAQKEYLRLSEFQLLQYKECQRGQSEIKINISGSSEENEKNFLFHNELLALSDDIEALRIKINNTQPAFFYQSFFLPKEPKNFVAQNFLISFLFLFILLSIGYAHEKQKKK